MAMRRRLERGQGAVLALRGAGALLVLTNLALAHGLGYPGTNGEMYGNGQSFMATDDA